MKNRKVFIHIGWPKAGSSTLQKQVFNKLDGFRYLGKTPFEAKKNNLTFNISYLLNYANENYFSDNLITVKDEILRHEKLLYGNINNDVPLIISEEGILTGLIRPVNYFHNGVGVSSPNKLFQRLSILQKTLNFDLQLLAVTRESSAILHSFYCQMYHELSLINRLNTFDKYIATGVSKNVRMDLGFSNLNNKKLQELASLHLNQNIYFIEMKKLFIDDYVMLNEWHPDFNSRIKITKKENVRADENNLKITHLRPIWIKKVSVKRLIKNLIRMIKKDFFPHRLIKIKIKITKKQQDMVNDFIQK